MQTLHSLQELSSVLYGIAPVSDYGRVPNGPGSILNLVPEGGTTWSPEVPTNDGSYDGDGSVKFASPSYIRAAEGTKMERVRHGEKSHGETHDSQHGHPFGGSSIKQVETIEDFCRLFGISERVLTGTADFFRRQDLLRVVATSARRKYHMAPLI